MSVIVDIIPYLVRLAKRKARERNASFENREGYHNDADSWGVDPETRNFRGVMGELAFACHADLQIDSNIYEVSDGGKDFVICIDGERQTVDLKTRRTDPFQFQVKEGRLRADYYVLAYILVPEDEESLEGWRVELKGAATKEEFLDAPMVDSGYGHQNHSILVEDLRPIPDPDLITQVEPT